MRAIHCARIIAGVVGRWRKARPCASASESLVPVVLSRLCSLLVPASRVSVRHSLSQSSQCRVSCAGVPTPTRRGRSGAGRPALLISHAHARGAAVCYSTRTTIGARRSTALVSQAARCAASLFTDYRLHTKYQPIHTIYRKLAIAEYLSHISHIAGKAVLLYTLYIDKVYDCHWMLCRCIRYRC